jgi:hypothetical protein
MFLPKLAKLLGSIPQAIILQQVHWLCNQPKSGIEHDGEVWVWGTYDEWANDYFPMWTPAALRKNLARMEESSLIVSTTRIKDSWDNTKYYRVNYDELDKRSTSNCYESSTSKREESSTSNCYESSTSTIYTETSTETSTREVLADASPPTKCPSDKKPLTEQQQWFQAICWIVGWGHKTMSKNDSGQVVQTIKILKAAGYTLDDVRAFWRDHWSQDWRWQKNKSRPTIRDLRREIGNIKDGEELIETAKPKTKVTDSMTAVDNVAKMLQEQSHG